jgi:chemotaxis protein MotB
MADTEEDDDGGGIPEWVVTFGDMMSLLLTFFIMLVSLSEIKQEEKYQALVESIKRQLGHSSSVESMTPGKVRPRNSVVQRISSQGRSKRLDTMRGGQKVEAPEGENPTVRMIRKGAQTVVGTSVTFPESSADLPEAQYAALQKQARLFKGKPQLIEIRGHTTRRPIPSGSPYQSHWDLSYTRCMNVRRILVEDFGIEENRIRLNLASSYEPIYRGTDLSELRQNPRVEVFELDEVVDSTQ